MSDLKINNITDRTGDSGPVIAGVSTVSSTGAFTVPVGPTEYRGGRGRGIFAGMDPSGSNIDKIEIATTGNSVSFGTLTRSKQAASATASSTRGVVFGGYVSPTYYTDIEYITISSTGNAVDFGDCTARDETRGACSNGHGGLG